MHTAFKQLILSTLLLGSVSALHAEPWFTGPILAPAGITIPLGHYNLEPYAFYTTINNVYGNHGNKLQVPLNKNILLYSILNYGLADKLDAGFNLPYSINESEDKKSQHLADTSVFMGFQALRQKSGSLVPNLRLVVREVFPTGTFDNLSPDAKGTAATGAGGYQTVLASNFEYLSAFKDHYLRTRFSLMCFLPNKFHVDGVTAFGGTPHQHGTIKPGNVITADLAGEFTLTQEWVAVMEVFAQQQDTASYQSSNGSLYDDEGNLINITRLANYSLTLAPAIEYNFSSHFGIIAGVWFSVKGKNTQDFTSAVIALNIYY